MSDWPKYESHKNKVVQAAQIIWIDRDQAGEVLEIQVRPVGGDLESFWPTVDEMAQKAEVGGWAILYPDDFRSISPAKQFEEGYTLLPDELSIPMEPSLHARIASAINCASAENGSNTPDYLLAHFLVGCLEAFDLAVQRRERWYGRGAVEVPATPTESDDDLEPPV
jgi:hypothetical protein